MVCEVNSLGCRNDLTQIANGPGVSARARELRCHAESRRGARTWLSSPRKSCHISRRRGWSMGRYMNRSVSCATTRETHLGPVANSETLVLEQTRIRSAMERPYRNDRRRRTFGGSIGNVPCLEVLAVTPLNHHFVRATQDAGKTPTRRTRRRPGTKNAKNGKSGLTGSSVRRDSITLSAKCRPKHRQKRPRGEATIATCQKDRRRRAKVTG